MKMDQEQHPVPPPSLLLEDTGCLHQFEQESMDDSPDYIACYCDLEGTCWSRWHAEEDLKVRDALVMAG